MTDSHGGGGGGGGGSGSGSGANGGGSVRSSHELAVGMPDARGIDVYSQPVRATSLSALLNPEAAAAAAHGLEPGNVAMGASPYTGTASNPLPPHYSLQATGEGAAGKAAKQFEATVGRAVAPMTGEGPMPQRAERFRNPAGTARGMPPLAPGYGSNAGYDTGPGTTVLGYTPTMPVGGAYGPGTGGGGTILPHYGGGAGHAHLAPPPSNVAYTGATYGMNAGGGVKRAMAAYPSYSPILGAGAGTGASSGIPTTQMYHQPPHPYPYPQHHHHQQQQPQTHHPLLAPTITQHMPSSPMLSPSAAMRPLMSASSVGAHSHQPSSHTAMYPPSRHPHQQQQHQSMVMPTHSSYYAHHQHQPPMMIHPMMVMSSPRSHPLGAAAPAYGFGSGGSRGASPHPLEADDDASSGVSSKPYARSPRLRHTHKLAERKRRSELRSMFEQLEALLPGRERSLSKSEVVQKAIEAIDQLVGKRDKLLKERESLRSELGESAPPTTSEAAQVR